MSIRFPCASCQKRIKVPDGTQGKRVQCPACGSMQRVPEHTVPEAPVATTPGGSGSVDSSAESVAGAPSLNTTPTTGSSSSALNVLGPASSRPQPAGSAAPTRADNRSSTLANISPRPSAGKPAPTPQPIGPRPTTPEPAPVAAAAPTPAPAAPARPELPPPAAAPKFPEPMETDDDPLAALAAAGSVGSSGEFSVLHEPLNDLTAAAPAAPAPSQAAAAPALSTPVAAPAPTEPEPAPAPRPLTPPPAPAPAPVAKLPPAPIAAPAPAESPASDTTQSTSLPVTPTSVVTSTVTAPVTETPAAEAVSSSVATSTTSTTPSATSPTTRESQATDAMTAPAPPQEENSVSQSAEKSSDTSLDSESDADSPADELARIAAVTAAAPAAAAVPVIAAKPVRPAPISLAREGGATSSSSSPSDTPTSAPVSSPVSSTSSAPWARSPQNAPPLLTVVAIVWCLRVFAALTALMVLSAVFGEWHEQPLTVKVLVLVTGLAVASLAAGLAEALLLLRTLVRRA